MDCRGAEQERAAGVAELGEAGSRQAALDRREGNPQLVLDDVRGPQLVLGIRELIERLRLEQEMKLGIVPTWSPPPTAEEAQA